jgi:hypothetical protein
MLKHQFNSSFQNFNFQSFVLIKPSNIKLLNALLKQYANSYTCNLADNEKNHRRIEKDTQIQIYLMKIELLLNLIGFF